jgi:hypothetical protein
MRKCVHCGKDGLELTHTEVGVTLVRMVWKCGCCHVRMFESLPIAEPESGTQENPKNDPEKAPQFGQSGCVCERCFARVPSLYLVEDYAMVCSSCKEKAGEVTAMTQHFRGMLAE